jgi:hypothetical protein
LGLIATGKFDQDYIDGVTRIGKVHAKLGLEPQWYIGGYSLIMGRTGQDHDRNRTRRFWKEQEGQQDGGRSCRRPQGGNARYGLCHFGLP